MAVCLCVALLPSAQGRPKASGRSSASASKVAKPKPENQFICVEDFKRARRAPKVAVSVEGYAVVAFRDAGGGYRFSIVDSVDHVLSAKDANAFARAGVSCKAPSSFVRSHPRMAWTRKGFQTWVMYTGAKVATKELHDVVPKLRVSGFTAAARTTVSPITGIEYMDDLGEWRKL